MNCTLRHIITVIAVVLLAGWAQDAHAQKVRKKVGVEAVWGVRAETPENALHYIVEDGDTIYIDNIRPSKVYSRLPRQKGKEWRKYYRLVHNFSKAYPYALVARKLVQKADSTIAADRLKWVKRDQYVNKVQKELFDVFEGQMRKMTVSQGALLMKLIDREVGKSSYNIIRDYKNGVAAGFWQGIAKIFGTPQETVRSRRRGQADGRACRDMGSRRLPGFLLLHLLERPACDAYPGEISVGDPSTPLRSAQDGRERDDKERIGITENRSG